MFKKLLGIMLAVILAVSPVATFAEDESAVTFPIAENFNFAVGDENLSAWTADGGIASFCSDDYGYLRFTANEAGATLSRELGITEGAFTVDFRIKAESTSGTATVSVGGMELTLDLTNKTLAGKSFIPKLWYNVRVASAGSTADVYIDGAVVSENTDITFENAFKIIAAQACVIGIDDFKVYAEKKTNELTSTPLDFKFDNFSFTNAYETPATAGTNLASPSINTENTKLDELTSWTQSVQGNAPVLGMNFDANVNLVSVKGKFGKSKDDNSIYFTNNGNGKSAVTNDSSLDFNIGKNGYIPNKGDKQVISFNMAFEGEKPVDFMVRSFNIYNTSTAADYLGGKAGRTSSVAGNAGWLMKFMGDRMYVFGNTEYYSIVPALLPNQWNNVRMEIEAGNMEFSSSADLNAMIISVYINDVPVIVEKNIPSTEYYVRNQSGSASRRGRFKGIHRLVFNYDWTNYASSETGVYLDDIKIENYLSGSSYIAPASPLIKEENGTVGIEESNPSTSIWNHDKWVQGNIVYVDSSQTLSEYAATLLPGRYHNIVFRDSSGNVINNWNTIFGNNTIYAEIIRTDYSRIYASLIGENTPVIDFALDGSSSSEFKSWSDAALNNWNYQNVSITSLSQPKGGKIDSFLEVAPAEGQSSNLRVKYAFNQRLSQNYAYYSADDFRPVTVSATVLVPEGSTFQMGAWHTPGPKGAYLNGVSDVVADGSKQDWIISMKNGQILNKSEDVVGAYNYNEWNRVEITFYPGYPNYRVDAYLNGKPLLQKYLVRNTVLQSLSWFIVQQSGGNVYIDDLSAVTGYYKPEAPAVETANKGVIDILSADKFLAQSGKSVADIKAALTNNGDVRIYTDATYATEQTGNVVTDNKIVVQSGAILKYFTIDTSDFVRDGNTIKSLARNADDKLYIALYDDEDATKLNSVISAKATDAGIIRKEVPASIKAFKPFLWNSLLVPYFGAGEAYSTAE